ncbi:MAG: hypothetical protein ACR2I2_12135 [Bryobacteraceae bacterium]
MGGRCDESGSIFASALGGVQRLALGDTGALIAALQPLEKYAVGICLLSPVPFLIFGLIYADSETRLLQAAAYIQKELLPKINELVDPSNSQFVAWEWEMYRRDKKRCPAQLFSWWLGRVRLGQRSVDRS